MTNVQQNPNLLNPKVNDLVIFDLGFCWALEFGHWDLILLAFFPKICYHYFIESGDLHLVRKEVTTEEYGNY